MLPFPLSSWRLRPVFVDDVYILAGNGLSGATRCGRTCYVNEHRNHHHHHPNRLSQRSVDLSVGGVHTFPLPTATRAQEVVHVSANALVKGVVILVQVFQVGDALARRCLPGGHTSQHQIGVEPQETDDNEPADDQDEEVDEEQDVDLEPFPPQRLVGDSMPGEQKENFSNNYYYYYYYEEL